MMLKVKAKNSIRLDFIIILIQPNEGQLLQKSDSGSRFEMKLMGFPWLLEKETWELEKLFDVFFLGKKKEFNRTLLKNHVDIDIH